MLLYLPLRLPYSTILHLTSTIQYSNAVFALWSTIRFKMVGQPTVGLKSPQSKVQQHRKETDSYLVPGSATRTSSWSKLRAAFVSPLQRRLVDLNLLGNPVKILENLSE